MLFNITHKQCSKCKKIKNLDDFYKEKRNKSGRHSWCIECSREKSKKWISKHPEQHRENTKTWYANHPEKIVEKNKKYREKYPDKVRERLKEWHNKNKTYANEVSRRWYHNNREYACLQSRTWAKENVERTRQRNRVRLSRKKFADGIITAQEERELFEKYNYTCINPNCPDTSQPITLDHIVPLARGGTNTIENAQPLCRSCNSSKGTKTIDYR